MNLLEKQVMKEKSVVAEAKFKAWLDAHKLAYWYIRQDLDTFSPALKKHFGSKRPDYMIMIPSVGSLLVDVKNYTVNPRYNTVGINCEETVSYSNLQRHFNFPVWFAVSNKEYDYETWLWAPVSKVLEVGKVGTRTGVRGEFFAVPMKEFIHIKFEDSLGPLFRDRFE